MNTDLKSLLNPEQYEAATAPDGPLLILAAAGTGKTRTLVYRVVHLLRRGVPASRLLLLTFTNRAAREMLERAADVTGGATAGIWGGTFHHVANRMLRTWAGAVGYPRDFSILDAEDQRSIMGRVIREAGFKPKEFAKKELVLSLLSGAVNRNVPIEEWLEKKADSVDVAGEDLLLCMRRYSERKREIAAMDFDDLLVNALRVLRENERARDEFQERFLHVLVDEYQDVNSLQSGFVDLVSGRHRNLSVVGDDFQCIYSWRGSDYRNIMDFPERHPGTKIVKLERNYRSLGPILELANASIVHNPDQFPKRLKAERPSESAPKPVLHVVYDGRAQGAKVAELVKSYRGLGYKPSDIAVLYRSHFHAVDAQLALAKASIPYRITSGTGFYEQAHVKDAIALLRVAQTPTDGLAFLRVLQLLPAVGESTAERLWKTLGCAFDVTDGARRAALADALPAKARSVWARIDAPLARWNDSPFPKNVGDLIEAFLDSFYREYLRKQFDNADEREEELHQLVSDVASRSGIDEFLRDVALLTNLDREQARENAGLSGPDGEVLLSTIHQAKGLEWPVVIMLWAVEGMFPSSRSLDDQGGDDEERRLFYVAVTRARERLHIVQPEVRTSQDGGSFPCERSRFLREVPDVLYEEREDDDGFAGFGGGDRWRGAGGGGGGRWRRDGGWGRSIAGWSDWSF